MLKALYSYLLASGALLAANLSILLNAAELNGPEARHQFLAEAFVDTHQEDWTRAAEWSSSNPKVATVDQTGLVTPVADGAVTITAKAKGESAGATVRVNGAKAPFTWSFRNHVIALMTKMGCNSGACHGHHTGKNGRTLAFRANDAD